MRRLFHIAAFCFVFSSLIDALKAQTTAFTLSDNALDFNADAKTSPPPQTVTVTNNTSSNLQLTIAPTTQSGGNWLSATVSPNPVPGRGTSTITVSVNSSKLPAGKYTGTITVTGAGTTAKITVSLTVSGVSISASPSSINVASLQAGKQQSTPVKILGGSANVQISVSVMQGSGWLSVNPASATAPGSFTVTVNAANLNPGQYGGTVTVQCVNGAPCLDVVIPVTTTVQPAPLTITTTSLPQATLGSTYSAIMGASGGTPPYIWSATGQPSGLTVNSSGGINGAPTVVGTFTVSFTVKDNAGATATTQLSLTVIGSATLVITPSPLSFSAQSGRSVQAQSIHMQVNWNVPSFKIDVSTTDGGRWLTVSPTSAVDYAVAVDTRSLAPGTYHGTLSVSCVNQNCLNTPIPVAVTLTLSAAPPATLSVGPLALSFQAYQGRPSPAPQNLLIGTSDASQVSFNITNIPPWLQVSPTSGAAGSPVAVISITALGNALSPGSNQGTLTIAPANGSNSVAVNVSATLSPFSIGVSPASPPPVAVSVGQTQTLSFSVTTVDGAAAEVLASANTSDGRNWLKVSNGDITAPGQINVAVDGSALTAGPYSGTVTFSCAAGACAPVQVPVKATVSTAPTIVAAPGAISFKPDPKGAPADQTISLKSSDNSTINFSISYSPQGSWVKVAPVQGSTPATLTVSMASVPAQDSSGMITITPSNGSAAVQIPVSWTASGTSAGGPSIRASGVILAGAFGGFTTISPGTYIEIYGSNLAQAERTWANADFSGTKAPTMLGDVTVRINGQAAFIDYISPGQVNALVPDNVGNGSVQLVLTNSFGFTAVTVAVVPLQPALLAPPTFTVNGKQYVGALFQDGSFAMPAGAVPGVASRPAKPGEVITLYGLGFGAVSPDTPVGTIAQGMTRLVLPLQVFFGQTQVRPDYAGLTPSSVGLYQINLTVPSVPDSDTVPLTFNLGGISGTQTLYIAVHR